VNIALRGVTKRFGAATAVDDLSLDVAPGELVSVVGGSGCGKTTTLRMIAGFERPDTGDILFDGRVVNGVPPRQRGVGIVFQSYALFPTMTVHENIAFGLRVARWPAAEIRARVAEMVGLTRLEGLEGRYANQLSGGQQQRVALARALARRPGILLLDEPLSALDAKIRLRLRGELRKIQQDLGITTVYVTHDQEEALSIADRIAVMAHGRIEQVGRPEEIYGAPRTEMVADFIGIANLLACRVVSASAGLVDWQGLSLRVPPQGLRDGAQVMISVRPEKLTITGPASGTGGNRLEGVVEVATFLGAIVRAEVAVAGRTVFVDVPHAQAGAVTRHRRLTLGFAPADCVVVAPTALGGASAG
jgi:putative spermidine/putrescine transport system ATP-binding protein